MTITRAVHITNPGTHPELFHAAAALRRAEWGVAYFTASMLSEGSLAGRVASCGPLQSTMSSRLLPPDLQDANVTSHGMAWEAAFQVALRFAPKAAPALLHRRNGRLTRRASSAVARLPQTAVVLAQHTAAEPVFSKAGSRLKVLNYPIAHHDWMSEHLQAEAERDPQWAPYAQHALVSSSQRRQFEEEVSAADIVLLASTFARSTFLSCGVPAAKLRVIPLACDVPGETAPARRKDPNELKLLFAGQVNQRKGLAYLLRAWRASYRPGMHLTIAGPIASAAKPLLEAPGITVLGPVSRARLNELYDNSDLTVLPSLAEGFGLTALESMGRGTPALVSTHTFGSDIITNGIDGFVVPAHDSDALASAFQACWNHPERLTEMRDRALITARAHSWARYESDIVAWGTELA